MKPLPIQLALRQHSNQAIAEHSLRYFKTGKGEYGEGDKFLGVRMPTIRATAKTGRGLAVADILRVLQSPFHEERLLALIMWVYRFEKSDDNAKREIYELYLRHTKYVNGWDLVDSSAHQIVGGYLLDKERGILMELASSESLWERRISIISTFHFIRRAQFTDTLEIAKHLLADSEDLIHKAVGWMLREVGNRDREVEQAFLLAHYRSMPRTMLRYAIEKFDEDERKRYLNGGK
jgi:3-methyladenine DNA glycosylase AlkD